MDVFAGLEHLVLSVRRHEEGPAHTVTFRNRLWEMIGKAPGLRSLCLVGLDLDEKNLPSSSPRSLTPSRPVRTSTQRDLTLEEWQFRSVPTIRRPPRSVLPHLACLELRRVEVMGFGLLAMFRCFGASLRELYLDHVYLKTVHNSSATDHHHHHHHHHHHNSNDNDSSSSGDNTLWVGLPNQQPPPNHRWIAVLLRQMLHLRVCRASSLGYDQYITGNGATAVGGGTFITANHTITPAYDLRDPSGLDRPLEQRFVEVVLGHTQPDAPDGSPVEYLPDDPVEQQQQPPPWLDHDVGGGGGGGDGGVGDGGAVSLILPPPPPSPPPFPTSPSSSYYNNNGLARPETETETGTGMGMGMGMGTTPCWWSAEHYLDNAPHAKNPTSGWQRNGIDGRFPNCNPFTLHELQHIADTALEGMSLIQLLEGGRLQDEMLAELADAEDD